MINQNNNSIVGLASARFVSDIPFYAYRKEVDSLLWNLFSRELIEFDMADIIDSHECGRNPLRCVDLLLSKENREAQIH